MSLNVGGLRLVCNDSVASEAISIFRNLFIVLVLSFLVLVAPVNGSKKLTIGADFPGVFNANG